MMVVVVGVHQGSERRARFEGARAWPTDTVIVRRRMVTRHGRGLHFLLEALLGGRQLSVDGLQFLPQRIHLSSEPKHNRQR